MGNKGRLTIMRWYLTQGSDSAVRNLLVTGSVAMVAALVVSTAATLLQPIYQDQQLRLRQASMENLIEKIPSLESLLSSSGADTFESHLVDLDTGCFIENTDPSTFNARVAENDPLQSRQLADENGDAMLLKRRSHYEVVYLLFNDDDLQLLVLPVHGPGYQSTLYAWLVIGRDLNTIVALNVYEHADTPGIGSRVENADWQAKWQGKALFDNSGAVAIKVVKQANDSVYEVDGISGATRTSSGVGNMVEFWVGTNGFGPLLEKLKTGSTCQ